MALVLADRVLETTTTTGSGTITLAGAEAGYQSFSAVGNGNQTYYTIAGDVEWEVGIGTYTASGTTLSRDTVLSSSNSGNKVTFSSGTKKVFVTYPSEKSVNFNVSGNISALSGVITDVADPVIGSDAANKLYVDTLAAQGISYHEPVKYEVPSTTGNLNATYNNGTGGVSATLTNAGTLAAFVPDGVTATISDRVLIYNQTNQFENGVYVVSTVGNGSTAWVLTRAADADSYGVKSPTELGTGDAFFVTSGNTGAGETYVCNTPGTIVFGSTAITFAQISSAQVYQAGNGVSITNTVISLATPVSVANGGTGTSSTPTNGQLLIGNGSGYTLATLTAGSGVSITNSAGSITLSATNSGAVTSVTATGPLASSGGTTPNISIANSTGTGSVVLDQGATISSATITAGISASITTITGTTAGFSSANITQLSGTSAGITTVTGTTTTFSSGTITQFGATSATIGSVSGTNLTYTNGNLTSATVTTISGTTATYASATVTNLALTSLTLANLSIGSANVTTLTGTNLTYTSGTITTLKSTSATIDNLKSTSADITTLTGTTFGTTATTQLRGASAQITTATVTSADITTLTGTTFGTTATTQLRGASGAITTLTGTSANITTVTGTTGGFSSANITTVTGTTATYTSATVTNLALTSLTLANLSIGSANVTTLTGTNLTYTSGTITTLKSTSATIDTIKGTSASITTITGALIGNASTATNATSATNSTTTSQRLFTGDIGTTGQGRFTGWYTGDATTAAAVEVGYSSGEGYVIVYNRATSTYGSLNIQGASCLLKVGGSAINVTQGSLQQGGVQVALTNSANITTLTGTNATFTSGTITTFSSSQVITTSAYGAMPGIKGSYFGYSSGYGAVVLGSTSGFITTCIAVDPVANPSGSYSGNGSEVMFRNYASFITPNSSNNGYHNYGNLAEGKATWTQLGSTSATITTLTSTSANITTLTGTTFSDGAGNVRNIPSAGADKTSVYTLAITDIGEYVGIGTGGGIDVPNGVFSTGNAITIFNNTTGNRTISLTITTAYIAGTDSDKNSVTLATRGLATILFLSNSVCVISGNVT